MKTVDALIAARDFFVNNPDRWVQGALHRVKGSKDCFCALGGLSLVTGCMATSGARLGGVAISTIRGPYGLAGKGIPLSAVRPAESLSQKVLNELISQGIHLKAASNAVSYLGAVAKNLYGQAGTDTGGGGSIMMVNDSVGYDGVIACFNAAITNAKRRHINGDRKKPVQASA